jgi:hypothetical protein
VSKGYGRAFLASLPEGVEIEQAYRDVDDFVDDFGPDA